MSVVQQQMATPLFFTDNAVAKVRELIEMAMGASVNGNLVRKDETSGLLTHEQKQPDSSIAGEDEDKSE